jgi:cytidylate kinase
MIIAIDGPAASGKSTTAQKVAERLGINYLDTGAMYRAVTLAILLQKLDFEDEQAVKALLDKTIIDIQWNDDKMTLLLNGEDVTDAIRSVEVTRFVSAVSAKPYVREKMVHIQRQVGNRSDCVVEGRDIGTVVFPEAEWKFYIIADYHSRAKRRQLDLEALGDERSLGEIVEDLKLRDQLDSTRLLSPMKKSDQAIEIDTTDLTVDEQVDKIINIVNN